LIGASAGGPAAVAAIIKQLPADFRAAIVLAQHVDSVFVPTLATWLSQQGVLPVRVAVEGDRPESGRMLVADSKRHLVFKSRHRLGYTTVPENSAHYPSIDTFFQSAARFCSANDVAILLTGMGRDGAAGLKLLREAGVMTIAQDAPSSAVYGMPKAAAEADAAKEILALNAIAPRLLSIFRRNVKPI